MHVDFITIAITILNLLILYYLMNRFLFKPVTAIMEKRTKTVESKLLDADQKHKEAEEYKTQLNQELKSAHRRSDEIIQNAEKHANEEAEKIMAEARADVSKMMQKAEVDILAEKEKAMVEMKNEVATLAFAVASKIIGRNMNTEENKQLVDQMLSEKGVAS